VALSDAFSKSIGIIFIIAIISALFPSVDGAITSLTSCFCIDILGLKKREGTEKGKENDKIKSAFQLCPCIFYNGFSF
jgi:hypothetical protein